VKVAVVVQRYGEAINGGAELHARYIAEHLSGHAEIEVLTTFANDYVTWHNDAGAAHERINGVLVRRFPVERERDLIDFSRWSARVFHNRHSLADELQWLESEGPVTPALVQYIEDHGASYDFVLIFSYRYYQAYHGARAAADRALLVPTAERDSAVGLGMFRAIFRGARGIMYNSPEERVMIQAVSGNRDVPGVVVGVGSHIPPNPQPDRFRQKYGIRGGFAIYVGRIDENKGCQELFEFFQAYLDGSRSTLSLILIGQSKLPTPAHPQIRHLGFLDDTDKFDAMAGADLLIAPSYFESLSMVTLEAWALGRPVLANGHCDVLHGQCIRSNAGLCYANYAEFAAMIRALEKGPQLGVSLGANGRRFFAEHYSWPVIERKYLDMFERLEREPARASMEPLPGTLERQAVHFAPAADIVASLPKGPAMADCRRPAAGAIGSAP
jgi:glycosyltransferase involved in cell wall biosynthesis